MRSGCWPQIHQYAERLMNNQRIQGITFFALQAVVYSTVGILHPKEILVFLLHPSYFLPLSPPVFGIIFQYYF